MTDEKDTTALTRRTSTAQAIAPRNMEEVWKMSTKIAAAQIYGVKNPEDAFVRVTAGIELGFSPIQALRAIHVIEGTPTLSADAMVALVRQSPDCEYFEVVESTADKCTIKAKRVHGSEQTCTWTMADAQRAELSGKTNWQRYPRQMLRHRASAELARQEFPEVALGIYTPDEISDGDVVEAEYVEPNEPLDLDENAQDVEHKLTGPRQPIEDNEKRERMRKRIFALLGETDARPDDVETARYRFMFEEFGATSMHELNDDEMIDWGQALASMSIEEREKWIQQWLPSEAA